MHRKIDLAIYLLLVLEINNYFSVKALKESGLKISTTKLAGKWPN